MDKKPIALIHTPCKLCVFAEYQDNTQIGCKLDYISKYKKNNIEILEVYDNDKNFYVINNKKCLGYRDSKWKEKNEHHPDLTLLVKDENNLKYITIIHLDSSHSMNQLIDYINSLLTQSILPKGILLYKNRLEEHTIKNSDLLDFMNSLQKSIEWKIQNFIDKDMTDSDRLKAAINSCPINRFYLLANIHSTLPSNCIQNIQNYIDNGNNFGCINIDNNKFFSYISVQYCKNIRHINLLDESSLHTKYETIS